MKNHSKRGIPSTLFGGRRGGGESLCWELRPPPRQGLTQKKNFKLWEKFPICLVKVIPFPLSSYGLSALFPLQHWNPEMKNEPVWWRRGSGRSRRPRWCCWSACPEEIFLAKSCNFSKTRSCRGSITWRRCFRCGTPGDRCRINRWSPNNPGSPTKDMSQQIFHTCSPNETLHFVFQTQIAQMCIR